MENDRNKEIKVIFSWMLSEEKAESFIEVELIAIIKQIGIREPKMIYFGNPNGILNSIYLQKENDNEKKAEIISIKIPEIFEKYKKIEKIAFFSYIYSSGNKKQAFSLLKECELRILFDEKEKIYKFPDNYENNFSCKLGELLPVQKNEWKFIKEFSYGKQNVEEMRREYFAF